MAMNPTTIQQLNRQQQGLPSNFARSVPGQSLTQPPGKYQWEKPARISSVEDALPKIMKSLNQPTTMKNVIMLIDAGVSIESIVRGITFNGFVEGEWTPDVAEMLNPILLLEVLTIANYAGLDDIRTVNSYPDDEIKSSKILEIMRELNPKKYERRRDEALQQKQMLVSEKEQEPLVEDGSFMAALEAPETVEEMPVAVDPDMPVASFMEQMPVEQMPVEQMPVEEEEELV
jgi:hypothetical protein